MAVDGGGRGDKGEKCSIGRNVRFLVNVICGWFGFGVWSEVCRLL